MGKFHATDNTRPVQVNLEFRQPYLCVSKIVQGYA
jgi:hypothetical protein